jgi:hypothetical protein
MTGKDVIEYYQTLFQIEFFQDTKGFTELTKSQARDFAKLPFNFNAFTSVNLAKVLERGIPFSMISYKTMIHNAYLVREIYLRIQY